MRVLLLTLWKPRVGGIVTHVENLIKNSRHEFEIVTYPTHAPIVRSALFILSGFLAGLTKKCDIIHAHYALPQGLLGVLLKKAKRVPLVITLHGSDVTILGKKIITRPLLKFVLKHADAIIAVSEFLKREVAALGIPGARIKVVYGGVSVPDKNSKNDEFELEGTVVTFIGSLVPQKGADIAVKAFAEVKSRVAHTKLVVVGSGKERKNLESIASSLKLEDVHFLGTRKNLKNILEKSSVLVLPSREEGFGLTLLEAMSCGVPVVASNAGGIPEIVQHGRNGLLVARDSPRELAEAIIRILSDEKLRDTLIKNGFETAKRFSWQKTAREVDEIYEKLAKIA